MPFPRRIREALSTTDCSGLSGAPAVEQECEGAKFHSPTPLLLHEVGLPTGGVAVLCGTCAENLAVFQHLLAESAGTLPWTVRREFGNLIRAIALRGLPESHDEEVTSA